MSKNPAWKFLGAVADGQSFVRGGLDVWKHEWVNVKERAQVENPHYHHRKGVRAGPTLDWHRAEAGAVNRKWRSADSLVQCR
jgi:hypothetical protein